MTGAKLSRITSPVHGGLDLAELGSLGLDPKHVVDFSASINPLGPSPAVREAVAGVDFAAYPDRHCTALVHALSARLGVGPDRILAGNGSTELVHLLARGCLGRGKRAFLFAPTFGEYEAACRIAGSAVSVAVAREEDGFQWNWAESLAQIKVRRPHLVFLCNPNNPTGVYLPREAVEQAAEAVRPSGLLVLDEAYLSFVDARWDSRRLLDLGNVVLLRSMTKDCALAGIRLGYLVGSPEILGRMRQLQPSWSVNAVAQAAGLAALEDTDHLRRAREAVAGSKAYLTREFVSLGFEVAPSAANFLLVKVGAAARLRLKLLRLGFCVRDCASFGLPGHIRVAARSMEDCQRLVAAFRKALGHE